MTCAIRSASVDEMHISVRRHVGRLRSSFSELSSRRLSERNQSQNLNGCADCSTIYVEQRYPHGRTLVYECKTSAASIDRNAKLVQLKDRSNSIRNGVSTFLLSSASYILPKGFPNSVGHKYERYVAFQAVDSISGTVCGVLSMQVLLSFLFRSSLSVSMFTLFPSTSCILSHIRLATVPTLCGRS